jgi:hypothetical protein
LNGTAISRIAKPTMYGAFQQIDAFASYDVWAASLADQDGLEHFDGASWTTVAPGGLYGVWGTAPNDLWLTTKAGTLEHWDGTSASQVATPGPSQGLFQVTGSSASDVWAVASTPLHYDGTTWSAMPRPNGSVYALWGTGPTNWYAAGTAPGTTLVNGVVWHWDGSSWTLEYTEPQVPLMGSQLSAIGGTGPNDVWVGGPNLDHVVHFDGTSWTPVTLPAPAAEITAIQAVGTNDLVLAGAHGYLARWNGTTLAPISQWTGVVADRNGVWGSSSNDVWMIERTGGTEHYDGSSWTPGTVPTAVALAAISGLSANDIWATGLGAGTGHVYAYHWSGSAWTGTDLGLQAQTSATYAAATNDAWIVTPGGHACHWNGTSWVATPTGITSDLLGVYGNASDAWAVGSSLVHWNGSSWAPVTSPSTVAIAAVWGRSPSDIYFGDIFGKLFHWNGTAFSALTGNSAGIASIGGDATRMWVVREGSVDFDDGSGGGLRHLDAELEGFLLYGAYFPSAGDGWIGGEHGARLRYRP